MQDHMKISLLILVLISCSIQNSFAQGVPVSNQSSELHKSENGSMYGDSRIEDLSKTMTENNESKKRSMVTVFSYSLVPVLKVGQKPIRFKVIF